jgi:aspartyl-tRNA(Asn)/glutamyl-tRNA(Gln) amidotransferase subunit C
MFSRAQVEAVGRLAHLELDPREIDLFTRQLGAILAHIEQLQQVDTSRIPATAGFVPRAGADRPDEVKPSLSPADALANAPEPALGAGLFKVPRIIG